MAKVTLQRRHYKAIADAWYDAYVAKGQPIDTFCLDVFANNLAKHNPNFKLDVFINRCLNGPK